MHPITRCQVADKAKMSVTMLYVEVKKSWVVRKMFTKIMRNKDVRLAIQGETTCITQSRTAHAHRAGTLGGKQSSKIYHGIF